MTSYIINIHIEHRHINKGDERQETRITNKKFEILILKGYFKNEAENSI